MSELPKIDRELIELYMQFGVLDKINAHLLDANDGLSVTMCGDPDQHGEALTYKKDTIISAGCPNRIHPPAPLGGALRLAPNSPANRNTPGYDAGLISDMLLVHDHKNIHTFALYVHAPCAVATLCDLGFADIIRLAFDAKHRIKRLMPDVKVVVFVHIDFGQGRRKTFYVCRQRWQEFHQPGPPNWAPELKRQFPDRVTIMPARA